MGNHTLYGRTVNVTTGPRQTKQVNNVLRNISSELSTHTEVWNSLEPDGTLKEQRMSFMVLFSGGASPDDPRPGFAKSKMAALLERLGDCISPDNYREFITAVNGIVAELQPMRPIDDKRETLEQKLEGKRMMEEAEAKREAERKAIGEIKRYSAAEVGSLARARLARLWPGHLFYVTTQTYSGGASMHVKWIDGPSLKEVEAVTRMYADRQVMDNTDYSAGIGHWMQPDGTVTVRYKSPNSEHDGEKHDRPTPDAVAVDFATGHVHADRYLSREAAETIAAAVEAKTGTRPKVVDSQAWMNKTRQIACADFDIEGSNDRSRYDANELAAETSFYKQPEPGTVPADLPASTGGNVTVRLNAEHQGVEVRFSEKPDYNTLADMKSHGFRWSKFQKLWYAKQTPERVAYAYGLAGQSAPEQARTTTTSEPDRFDMAVEDQMAEAAGVGNSDEGRY